MAVCSAWKNEGAGLSHSTVQFSAQEFADMLVLCGVPCFKTDVENGKKRPFTPNRVPQTPAVLKAIDDLKTFMPTLNAGELLFKLASDDRVDLGSVATCRFIDKLVGQGVANPI